MRHSSFRYLAAASLLLAALALAETRPRYGGTLRIETASPLTTLDPAQDAPFAADAAVRRHLAMLIFDRLVGLDAHGRPQPALALSWEQQAEGRRWQFHLRRGVRLHDGSPLPARLVVTSLAAANPRWRIHADGDDVVIESDTPLPNLLAQLALAHNSITAVTADGKPVGSGPFRISEWQPGKRLLLVAYDDYWGGRPFLDRVEIQAGRAFRDQALDLQLGRADVVEIPAEQVRRAMQDGGRIVVSAPCELLAVLFGDRPAAGDPRLRQTISLLIDRAAIQNTLVQKQGEASADLLPQWVSGFSFLTPVSADVARARQLRAELTAAPPLTLAYDWSDPLAKAVAERVAVNARDAGITVQSYGENLAARPANSDARIVRLALASPDAAPALVAIARSFAADAERAETATTPEEIYSADRSLLQQFKLLPVVYVPEAYGLSPRVRNWMQPRAGGWPLADVWVEAP